MKLSDRIRIWKDRHQRWVLKRNLKHVTKILVKIDQLMNNAKMSRQERRHFWRLFVKDRNHSQITNVFEDMTKDV